MSKANWQWDNNKRKWSCTDYPTYSWGLHPKQTVYDSPDMLEAIEVALKHMERYPDAERLIAGLKDE